MSNVPGNTTDKITMKITTPRGLKFVEEADMIVLRAIDGEMGILPGHAPVVLALGDGVLRIKNNDIEKKLAVFEGIAEISNNEINIFTTIAQRPDEIDFERAEEDRLEAEAAVQEEIEEHMSRRIQVMLTRALIRINVSQTGWSSDDDDSSSDD